MTPGSWLRHPLANWRRWQQERQGRELGALKYRYQIFRALLEDNHRALALLTEIGAKLRTGPAAGLGDRAAALVRVVGEMLDKQEQLSPDSIIGLTGRFQNIAARIHAGVADLPRPATFPFCIPLAEIDAGMLPAVGGKAAHLAVLKRLPGLRVPDGFSFTVGAGRYFLEHDGLLLALITRLRPFLAKQRVPDPDVLAEVRQRILAAPMPSLLAEALAVMAAPWFHPQRQGRLAVRSSAVAEDSRRHSFAGQFATVLNVASQEALVRAVQEVIASAFSGRNIAYRLQAGLDPLAYDLAILCLDMVDAQSSGTMFSRDPNEPHSGRMLISAVFGLGELAVSGSGSADIYRPIRFGDAPATSSIAVKKQRLVPGPTGGTMREPLPQQLRNLPVLSPAQLAGLVQAGLVIERKFGIPQDIEWACDGQGQLVILQSRTFRMAGGVTGGVPRARERLLLDGGMAASRGEGVGMAHLVLRAEDLQNLPPGPLVLLLRQSLPDAVEVLDRVAALVVDLGNPVDHLSCIAREFGIPMLTGIGQATNRIPAGTWVVVNANEGFVFAATDEEVAHARTQKGVPRPTALRRAEMEQEPGIGELYAAIIPLHLTDAYGPTFSVRECQSLHDVIRYLHEKAVLSMFAGGDTLIESAGSAVHHLRSEVPFLVSLIDLGGGLAPETGRGRTITAAQVRSVPFLALWRGVATPGLRWGPPADTSAAGGVMSRWLTDHRAARPIGMPNYALVSRDYLNLNARMDFHFIMVDCLCGIDPRSNAIRFRFKGGGTTLAQRRRRVASIAEILESSGFLCNVQDDLLTATLQGGASNVIEEQLVTVGRLLGFTRLLDAAMIDDRTASAAAHAFLAGDYGLSALTGAAAQSGPSS